MKTPACFPLIRRLVASFALLVPAVLNCPAQTSTGAPPVPVLSVNIVAPTNGTFYAAPADIDISANARDFGSFIHVISFYANSNLLQTYILDPLGPSQTNGQLLNFQYNWTNVSAGAYTLTVVVSDTAGHTATSAPVNVTVLTLVPPLLPVVTIFATDPIAVTGTNFPAYAATGAASNYFSISNNTATFLVRRTGASTATNLTVYYSIGGTASNGVDYAKISNNATIPAGKTYALITIVPLRHVTPVALPLYRTVILTLTEPPTLNPLPDPYIIGWPKMAEIIILERERFPEPPFPPVGPPTPPPFGPLADGSFNVNYSASNGANYSIQVSTDLINWTQVCVSTVVKGACVFIDPETGTNPARYYRAVPAMSPAVY